MQAKAIPKVAQFILKLKLPVLILLSLVILLSFWLAHPVHVPSLRIVAAPANATITINKIPEEEEEEEEELINNKSSPQEILFKFSTNYLHPPRQPVHKEAFLVYNNKCRIADENIWNKQVLQFISGESISNRCDKTLKIEGVVKGLTSVKNQLLLVNRDALIPLRLNLNDIQCCYQVVQRLEQNDTNYNEKDADNKFSLSEKCYEMEERSYPHAGFLKVTCHWKGNDTHQPVNIHTDFHLLPIFPKDQNASLLAIKLRHWNECRATVAATSPKNGCRNSSAAWKPPSVLIIQTDSMSRMHFRRMMNGTVEVLENEIGAVEMKGFTKVGMNTFPTLVPLMTPYSEAELAKYCLPNWLSPMDNCPFLWKNFSAQNYLTATLEDSPGLGVFNHRKLGFVRQPVDVYPRPWMLAAYQHNRKNRCIGYRRTDQVLLDYLRDLVGLADSRGIPYFVVTLLTDYTHESLREPALVDVSLRDTLLQMKVEGSLDNTLLIVMGDHGHRYLKIRQTLTGWFEDKLPAMWIKLPESLIKTQPTWQEAIGFNSKQLITPFDIHATLINLVASLEGSRKTVDNRQLLLLKNNKAPRGRSLFQKLPDRSCQDAGVPWEFCSCVPPADFKGNKSLVETAARTAIHLLNSEISSKCNSRLTLWNFEVIAVGIVAKVPLTPKQYHVDYMRKGWIEEEHIFNGKSHLVVGLSNKDNYNMHFEMEVFLAFNATSKGFDVLDMFVISRMNDFLNTCIPSLGDAWTLRQAKGL